MKTINKYFLICATVMGLGVAGMGAAISAPPAERAEWGCGYGPGMGRNWDNGQFGERMKQRVSRRHAYLHDQLKLNAEQEKAWQTYTASSMRNVTPPRWNQAEVSKLTAPERMEKMLQNMKEREQQMAAHLEATKTFYATLTPEQQKIFDAEWGRGPRQGRRGPGGAPGPYGK